ncbi:MAG: FMN-binding protein [Spirochaetales bacterium]|nr:FMN-binding protein [Spirochaetales bacterium]
MKINLKMNAITAGKFALVAFTGILLVCIAQISVYVFSQKREAHKVYELNKQLFPEAENFVSCTFTEQRKGVEYFEANNVKIKNEYFEVQDSGGLLIGYVIFVCGNGFFSELPLYVAFSDTLQIRKVLLLSTKEIKGKRWEDSEMLKIFEGTTFPPPKSENELFDSVSGATITFNGIVEAVKGAISVLSDKGK